MLAVFGFCVKLSDFWGKKSQQGVYRVVPIEQWNFEPSIKGDNCSTSVVSSNTSGLSLEEQIRPWKENPTWIDDSPDVKVAITPKNAICDLNLIVDVGLPPEAVHDILTDPEKGYFNTTERKTWIKAQNVLSEGLRQVIEVKETKTRIRWCPIYITKPNHVLVDQNKEDYTIKFKLKESDTYRENIYEGCWKMEPIFVDAHLCFPFKPTSVMNYVSRTKGKGRIATRLTLQKLVRRYGYSEERDMTARDEKIMVDRVFLEAAKMREDLPSSGTCIKERWALRRKIARNNHRKLSSISNLC